ncbi:MAG: RNA polymerase sigma factor [Bacteroidales bacterium]|nr:RNA polymerase sigma factor [Bacteroidales bacterium]
MNSQHTPNDETIGEKLIAILPLLKTYAFSLTGDIGRAADLLQDTSVKVLCNFDSFVYNGNFKGWAATIMYNIFLNERVRSARSVSIADGAIFDGEYRDCYIDAHEIICAINSLPIEYCLPFSMYADGYKYHEIAEGLNVPIGTVKSRIHTARTKLQELLKDYVR